jgi:hypothetical protein
VINSNGHLKFAEQGRPADWWNQGFDEL